MEKYPKYISTADNRPPWHPAVRLTCVETGRTSLLPTYGVTTTSDNSCTWKDFVGFAKRVGLKADQIAEFSRGECVATFVSDNEDLSPICIDDCPNVEERYSVYTHQHYTPPTWIFG